MVTLPTKNSGDKIPYPLSSFTLFQRAFILNAVKAGSSRSEAQRCSYVAWRNASVEEKKHWKKQQLIYKELHSRKYPGWKRPPPAKKKKTPEVSVPSGDTNDEQPGDINEDPRNATAEEKSKEPEMDMNIGLLTEDGQRLTASDLFSRSQIQEAKRYVMNLLGDPSVVPPKTTNTTVCEQSAYTPAKPVTNVVEIDPIVSRLEPHKDQLATENQESAAPNDSSDVEEDPDFEQLYFLNFYREEIEPQCTQPNGKGMTTARDGKPVKATATVEEHASRDGFRIAESESPSVSYCSSGKGRKLSTPSILPGSCVDIPKKRNRSFSEADVHPPAVRVRSGLGLACVLGTT